MADSIADIMGMKSEKVEEKKAVILCSGEEGVAADKYNYVGENDCIVASKLQGGGAKDCSYGCLGYGSCIKVCRNNAIKIINGIASVDEEKCGGCGECVTVCPKKVI